MTLGIEKAIEVAIRIHKGQMRKGNGITPYVVHPISVAMILSRYTNDEDVLIAALLHDALEDTTYSQQKLKKDFGSKVLSIVKAVSDKKPDDPWFKRKDAYLKHLKIASKEACLVACADKVNNLMSICEAYEKDGDRIWPRFNAPKEAKIGFYEAICKKVGRRFRHPIVNELSHKLIEAKKILRMIWGPKGFRNIKLNDALSNKTNLCLLLTLINSKLATSF